MPPDVLFDLDGTLIDSSVGVLSTFERLLASRGLTPVVKLDASIIGPPLEVTLRHITGIGSSAELREMADAFKNDYDSRGYRETVVYAGVPDVLRRLVEDGSRLFVVTNKRMVPTRAILGELTIERLFAGIHTRDETEPPALSKSDVVRRLISRYGLEPRRAIFVGDSEEDAAAALENGLAFVHAEYGYGVIPRSAGLSCFSLKRFRDLPAVIERFAECSESIG